MIKYITALIFALILYGSINAQDVKTLNSTAEIQTLFDSLKGKVVMVNFWATWCPPCVKEFPELVKLRNDYKDMDFELVFISLDEASELDKKLKPFLKKQGVDFTSYLGIFPKPEELMEFIDKKWQGEIPVTYVYDKEGQLKAQFMGSKTYEQFETEVKKLVN